MTVIAGGRGRFIARLSRRAVSVLIAATILLTATLPALASLTVDLRFSNSATDTRMDLSSKSAGDTVTIQVWATVAGTDTDLTNDALNSIWFGVISSNSTPSNLTGGLISGSLVSPFNELITSGPGTFADRNSDGIADWRGTATQGATATQGWPKASAGVPTMIPDSFGVGQASATDSHAWEFHVADTVLQISSITLPAAGSLDVLSFVPRVPSPITVQVKAAWQEDGVIKTGTASQPAVGTGVTFTLSAVPEPSSILLFGVGSIGLLVISRAARKSSR